MVAVVLFWVLLETIMAGASPSLVAHRSTNGLHVMVRGDAWRDVTIRLNGGYFLERPKLQAGNTLIEWYRFRSVTMQAIRKESDVTEADITGVVNGQQRSVTFTFGETRRGNDWAFFAYR